MIKEIAIQEIGRLQGKHRDLVQDVELGKRRYFVSLRLWYLENRIQHWMELF